MSQKWLTRGFESISLENEIIAGADIFWLLFNSVDDSKFEKSLKIYAFVLMHTTSTPRSAAWVKIDSINFPSDFVASISNSDMWRMIFFYFDLDECADLIISIQGGGTS